VAEYLRPFVQYPKISSLSQMWPFIRDTLRDSVTSHAGYHGHEAYIQESEHCCCPPHDPTHPCSDVWLRVSDNIIADSKFLFSLALVLTLRVWNLPLKNSSKLIVM
jgi:hypothetical protein